MGISLLDCRAGDAASTAEKISDKIRRTAGTFVETCDRIGSKYGVPVVNKRISVTPVAHIGAGYSKDDFIRLAGALDQAGTNKNVVATRAEIDGYRIAGANVSLCCHFWVAAR